MNEEPKISLTEIDRERWRYILYQSNNNDIYGDFSYQPTSFVDTSILIKLDQSETQKVKTNRESLLQLSEFIRNNYVQFEKRRINRKLFNYTRRPNYNIKSIDLNKVNSINELHLSFKKTLNFHEFYGMNWDAFWDSITGLVKMPTNLILYNFRSIVEKFKEEAGILRRTIIDFNKLNSEEQIQLDYLDELPKLEVSTNPSCLFQRQPFQFGFRGDLPLWDDLEKNFQSLPFPVNEDELTTQIHSEIEKLTKHRILEQEKFFVEKYNKGGMSGGYVSSQFWIRKAIPIILSRFKEMKKAGNK